MGVVYVRRFYGTCAMSSEGEPVKRVRQMSEDGDRREREMEPRVSGGFVNSLLRLICVCVLQTAQALPLLAGLDQRWRNWWIRGVLSVVMISLFVVVVYLGPIALSLMVSPLSTWLTLCSHTHTHTHTHTHHLQVVCLLLKCFQEIITIGYSKYRENVPLYRVFNWFVVRNVSTSGHQCVTVYM